MGWAVCYFCTYSDSLLIGEACMRVVITGGTGFIGRYVVPLLIASGHDVHIIAREASVSIPVGANLVSVDLLNQDACRRAMQTIRPDCLLHLAWYAEHGKFWTAAENFAWMHATSVLLDAFRHNGGRRAILAGTCAEYDWSHGICVEGETPLVPRTIYGKSKDAIRQFAENYCASANIELVWARIFFPYGMGEPAGRLLPSVIRALFKGEVVKCSHGRQFRDFLHVSDIAAALVHLIKTSGLRGAFNLGSGEPVRISTLVNMCASHFEHAAKIEFGSVAVPDNDPMMLIASAEKLISTGWQPQVSIHDGICQYVMAYSEFLRSEYGSR